MHIPIKYGMYREGVEREKEKEREKGSEDYEVLEQNVV